MCIKPPTFIVPTRQAPLLDATEYLIFVVPPDPEGSDKMLIQLTLLTTFHTQPLFRAVSVTVAIPPKEVNVLLVGDMEVTQVRS